jgi:CpXC protein
MSAQEIQTVACPTCNSNLDIEVFHSLNPSRVKNAVESILEDQMQVAHCKCGERIRLEPEFVYMDMDNKICIAAYPSTELENRHELEVNAKVSFDKALSESFAGKGIRNRITFGWPALKEKVLAQFHSIADVDLELVKLAVIKESGQMPINNMSLRLMNVDETHLVFGWHENLAPHIVSDVLT